MHGGGNKKLNAKKYIILIIKMIDYNIVAHNYPVRPSKPSSLKTVGTPGKIETTGNDYSNKETL